MPFLEPQNRTSPIQGTFDQKSIDDALAQNQEQVDEPDFLTETLPAAFQENTLSVLLSESIDHSFDRFDDNYNPFDDLEGYEEYSDTLLTARNKEHAQSIKSDIDKKRRNDEILARSGVSGMAAMLGMGLLDPINLAPAAGIIKSAKGSVSILKTGGSAALYGSGALSASEIVLQASQPSRSYEESGYSIASGAVFGGVLGLGGAAFARGTAKRASKIKEIEKDMEIPVNDDEIYVDNVFKSVGAAAVQKETLEQLGLKGTLGLAKMTSFINPYLRLIHSPFVSARKTVEKMLEQPLALQKIDDGMAMETAAETYIKLYDESIGKGNRATQNGYKELKKRGAKINAKDYRERLSKAMRRGDVDTEFAEITKAAQTIRKEVFDKIKKEAIDVGALPEDIAPRFADTYVTRMWNTNKLTAFEPEFKEILRDWARPKLRREIQTLTTKAEVARARLITQANKLTGAEKQKKLKEAEEKAAEILDDVRVAVDDNGNILDDYIEDVVDEVFGKLTGQNFRQLRITLTPITRGPLKEKLLDIDDVLVEQFLENDIQQVINYYVHSMAPQIELRRAFGRVDLKDQMLELENEYIDLLKQKKTEKERLSLRKKFDQAKKDLEDTRDMLTGDFYRNEADSWWNQIQVAIRDLNYMRALGGVTVSSFPDMGRAVMVNGLRRAFGDLIKFQGLQKEVKNLTREELQMAGLLFEGVTANRLQTLADITDPYARTSPLTRFTGSMSNQFSKITFMAPWNDMMKQYAGMTSQQRIAKAILENKDKKYLLRLGLPDDVQEIIKTQFKKHGQKEKGFYVMGSAKWDNSSEVQAARRKYSAALRKEVDTIIVTRGVGDVPTVANKGIGKLIVQFRTFLLASHQRVLLRGLQDRDAAVVSGVLTMMAAGMLTAAIKNAEYNMFQDTTESIDDWDAYRWFAEGLDRSGLLGLVMETNNIYEKLGGYGIMRALGEAPASRFASRNIVGTLGGPSAGLIESTGVAASGVIRSAQGDKITAGEIGALRRLLPFQNAIGFRQLFDLIENEAVEEIAE